ncbi:hypothetical protein GCM10009619_22500 [Williamsia maris]
MSRVSSHTAHIDPPKTPKPNSENTADSTARCQMKIAYDQRPRACITAESRNRNRPAGRRTIGASNPKPTIAPSTILTAN